jgi:predicted NAD/FAD-binding protein
MRRIAIVGSGIAGLTVAHRLKGRAHVTLFEAGDHFGGHTHTVDLSLPDAQGRAVSHGVDTGFLVFNERTYPGLIALFEELGIATALSDMSFSVQSPRGLDGRSAPLEWSGSDLNSVFAQRRNLVSPRFWRLLADLMRFNRLATRLAESGDDTALQESTGAFLDRHRFGTAFREGYLLPMIGCIWSCPTGQMLRFPIGTLIRFCHNHGLIQVAGRPRWFTVRGGARHYVEAIVSGLADARLATPVLRVDRSHGGVRVDSGGAQGRCGEIFDDIVLACHSDQALTLLGEGASPLERDVLQAIAYRPNRAVLHTDTALMPTRPLAWAAWNYERSPEAGREDAGVCLHYWLNRLQPLPWPTPVIVTLNPVREPRPETVLAAFSYDHPVFDQAAVAAQQRVPLLQGRRHTWFCGAWCGYGFHEDGLRAGMAVVEGLKRRWLDEQADRIDVERLRSQREAA